MTKIFNTTLVAVDCYNYGGAISALQKSMQQCEFDSVKFLTDIPIQIDGIETVQIDRINSKEEYSRFIIKELYKYIDTRFVLIVQHDGYVINGNAFHVELYNYDYAGALWLENDGFANGNGGFSWRSKRLCEIIATDPMIKAVHPEDAVLCRTYRPYLESHHGLRWATDELCKGFSFELREPTQPTFGFHGSFYKPYKPHVVLKRSGAMGDIVLVEPVIRWYCENGYQVVLDIPAQFFDLYAQYKYHIKHISHINTEYIMPVKEINLDMAYEIKQDRPYIQSYFEACGITDYKLTKPQFYPSVSPDTRLFKSYAVLHIDKRDTPERNSYGINWNIVKQYLKENGIDLIQIGFGEHEQCGLWVNTPTVAMMKYVIAGASLFIGADSGPSNIAVAQNIPSIILFGSVDPGRIHVDMHNIGVVTGDCDKSGCWHNNGSTTGQICHYKGTDNYLQCCNHNTAHILMHIENLLKNENG